MKTPHQLKPTLVQKVNPVNKDEEKDKFLFDTNYNPQFEYVDEISKEELEQYGPISDKYLSQAKWIIDAVIKQYGTESNYIEQTEGRLLSEEEVRATIQKYLQENELQDRLQLSFSKEYIARAAIRKIEDNFLFQIRLPLDFREHAFQGTLNHEIGTHVFRWLNEMKQPWYRNRSSFRLQSYLSTEEGLAAINSSVSKEVPLFWTYALYYYTAYQASQMSFSELYRDLKKYVDDRDRRWKFCLRVKRGVRDTSLPLAFSKDQVYFTGIIQLSEWLRKHHYNFHDLYLGKISLQDIPRVKKISQDVSYMPHFLKREASYAKEVERVLKANKI